MIRERKDTMKGIIGNRERSYREPIERTLAELEERLQFQEKVEVKTLSIFAELKRLTAELFGLLEDSGRRR